jgi:hypothetical protein
MSEPLSPDAGPAAPGRRVPARGLALAAALLVAVLTMMMSMMGSLPRAPTATTDPATWKLFGRPPEPGNWVAGDGSYPVPLPDGQVAWLFGDSQVRRADGTDAIIHNAIVVQTGRGRLRTLAGGITAQGRLMVFAEEFTRPASGGEGFQATDRRYLVPFQLPDLSMGPPQAVYDGPVAWGHAVLVSGAWVYVYGNLERDDWTNLTYLARFRLGHSGGYWQFWNGRRFAPEVLAAAPLQEPDGRALVAKLASVIPILHPAPAGASGEFAALTIDPFATTIDLRVASRPQGPWSARHILYAVPEPYPYLPHAHPDSAGTVQLAYSVADGRPRYLTLKWRQLAIITDAARSTARSHQGLRTGARMRA